MWEVPLSVGISGRKHLSIIYLVFCLKAETRLRDKMYFHHPKADTTLTYLLVPAPNVDGRWHNADLKRGPEAKFPGLHN